MKYTWEPLSYLLNTGIDALGARSWNECGYDKHIFSFDPDYMRYQRMEDANSLRFLAIRDDAEILTGYAAVIIGTSLHDKNVSCAVIQDIFIAPEFRNGLESIRAFEDFLMKQLKLMQVQHVTIAEPLDDPRGGVGAVWKRLGYHANQTLWAKELN